MVLWGRAISLQSTGNHYRKEHLPVMCTTSRDVSHKESGSRSPCKQNGLRNHGPWIGIPDLSLTQCTHPLASLNLGVFIHNVGIISNSRSDKWFGKITCKELLAHLLPNKHLIMLCCYRSVAKLCPTVCDPMDCSMPGSSVLHCLPEFAQIHVHWVGDAA